MATVSAAGVFTKSATGVTLYLGSGAEVPELAEGELERLTALGVIAEGEVADAE